jgi:hypothetical protein
MLTILMALKSYHPVLLDKAVASVFAQDSPDWRLMVLVEAADEVLFAGLLREPLQDHRVSLVPHGGTGLAVPFNTGMRRATTDFVAILHGDDTWSSDAVRVLNTNIARYPDVDFFHSSRRFVDADDRPLSSVYRATERFTSADFHWGSPVKHLLCWRRSLALSFGGVDESLPPVGPDDYDFPWCMLERGAVFRAVPECLYIYRDHREGYRLTTHLPLTVHVEGTRRILEKHGVPPHIIEARLKVSGRSYLQQCLYDSPEDQVTKEQSGHDPRTGWREKYR